MRPAGCSDSIRDQSKTHKHIVAVIPARYASVRFPGKALLDIAGRPMIEHVYRRAAASRNVDAVIVATDDPRIADSVKRFGGEARLTSPNHRTGTDRLAEVAAELDCDLVVNVQGDEPLIEPDSIDEAIEPFESDPELLMSTLCTRLRDPLGDNNPINDPNIVKVVRDQRGFALYFSRVPIPFRRGSLDHLAASTDPLDSRRSLPSARRRSLRAGGTGPYKHIGLYVYRREFLLRVASLESTPLEHAESLEQLRVLEHGFPIKVIETKHDSIGVDTPEDLERVRRMVTADVRA